MTADKTREAIQPRHRNAWAKWIMLRALGMRGWRVRGRFPKPFWRTLVVMHAPHTWQGTWAKWLYPVQSIRVDPQCDETCAHGGMVLREMRRFPHRRQQLHNWNRPKLGRNPAGHASPCAHGSPNAGSSTSMRPSNRRSTPSETCITWRGTSSISYRITLIMSELRKLSTGCSQSQKTRGKPVNNGGSAFFHSSRGKVLSCCSNLSSTKRLNP